MSTCSVDVDECSSGSTKYGVCHSENTMDCVNSVRSYTCVCKSGVSGKTCQRNGTGGSTTQSRISKYKVGLCKIYFNFSFFNVNVWN